MKILHLMLFNFFIDDAFYQENILPKQNKIDGHEVLIIASTHVFGNGNSMKFVQPITYWTKDGIKVIRLPYRNIINKSISEKIRAFIGVYDHLEEFHPDIIFSHGIGGYESKTIIKYLKNYPKTKLYIDCHSDFLNSASNFISKNILHRLFYRYYFREYATYAKKIYYITPESLTFIKSLYGFDDSQKLEYLPLGGYIIDENKRNQIKKNIRKELNIGENDIVMIHSGKLDAKKKSYEIIKAFSHFKQANLWLLIVGTFTSDVYSSVKQLIELNDHILFLGWKKGEELQDYLCTSDIYLQPGSRTVTVQNAVCCGCAIITNKSLCYTYLFNDAAIYAETEDELIKTIKLLADDPNLIVKQKKMLTKIAKEKLDYKIISNSYID